jgi:hypothetical protein
MWAVATASNARRSPTPSSHAILASADTAGSPSTPASASHKFPEAGLGSRAVRAAASARLVAPVQEPSAAARISPRVRSAADFPAQRLAQSRLQPRGVPQRRPAGVLVQRFRRAHGGRCADSGRTPRKGAARWSQPFPMADTPDYPDCNPVLFIDARRRLWLVWITILNHRWEGSLLKYRACPAHRRVAAHRQRHRAGTPPTRCLALGRRGAHLAHRSPLGARRRGTRTLRLPVRDSGARRDDSCDLQLRAGTGRPAPR